MVHSRLCISLLVAPVCIIAAFSRGGPLFRTQFFWRQRPVASFRYGDYHSQRQLTSSMLAVSVVPSSSHSYTGEDALQNGARNDTAKLWSYASSLQRLERRIVESPTKRGQALLPDLKSAKSLAHFLSTHQVSARSTVNVERVAGCDYSSTVEPLSRAVVYAMRLASSQNDYRLIQRLFQSCLHYSTISHIQDESDYNDDNGDSSLSLGSLPSFLPILDPRILGETVAALAKTSASIGKIKAIWKHGNVSANSTSSNPIDTHDVVVSTASPWTRPVKAREVNAMLQVLADRNKVRAALDLYKYHHDQYHRCNGSGIDSYSVSIVLTMLRYSVEEQSKSDKFKPIASWVSATQSLNQSLVPVYGYHDADLQALQLEKCWQWTEALTILDGLLRARSSPETRAESKSIINNPVISNFVQLSGAVDASIFTDHNRASVSSASRLSPRVSTYAWNLMTAPLVNRSNSMQRMMIPPPDIKTCTVIVSHLEADWTVALSILRSMQYQQTNKGPNAQLLLTNQSTPFELDVGVSLPAPNIYTYSATMACLARSGNFDLTLDLLREIEHNTDVQQANTFVLNTVLSAVEKGARKYGLIIKRKREQQTDQTTREEAASRLNMALRLYTSLQCPSKISKDQAKADQSSIPDTATYTILLSLVAATVPLLEDTEWAKVQEGVSELFERERTNSTEQSPTQHLVCRLMQDMQQRPVQTELAPRILQAGLRCIATDKDPDALLEYLDRYLTSKYEGSITIDVLNTAMKEMACLGSMIGMQGCLTRASEYGIEIDAQSILHIVDLLRELGKSICVPLFLLAITGNDKAAKHLSDVHQVALDIPKYPEIGHKEYERATLVCLEAYDFDSARKMLVLMKDMGMRPSPESLQSFARTYAVASMQTLTLPGRPMDVAAARAKNAFTIVSALSEPKLTVVALVGKACAGAGLFSESDALLQSIHKRFLHLGSAEAVGSLTAASVAEHHTFLLRSCSDHGNATYALRFCESIQDLAQQLSGHETLTPTTKLNLPVASFQSSIIPKTTNYHGEIGMKVREWHFLIAAAAKSGQWRLCVSALQFLKPYLEATAPCKLMSLKDSRERVLEYSRMSPSLNNAVRCLSKKKQYGWAIRVIEDWITWSNQRPPRSAMISCCRILAARGRGEEANALLSQVVSLPALPDDEDYESSLYTSAITFLHKNGMYDLADEAFVSALEANAISLPIASQPFEGDECRTVDLHGMNVAMAHSAVRIALQQEFAAINQQKGALEGEDTNGVKIRDVVIITGRGRNSALRLRPVLRPEVQRMLVEEFYPPLNTISVVGNLGALRIASSDIDAWLRHQQEQKGVRILAIAAVLRKLARADQLRDALARTK